MRWEQYVKLNTGNASSFSQGPEQVLAKIYQASGNNDLKAIFQKDARVELSAFKLKPPTTTDTARNFLLLDHKLTFTLSDGQELSIIKYTEYLDSAAAKTYTVQILGKDNHWLGANMTDYHEFEYAMSKISDREFWSLSKKAKLTEDDLAIPDATLARVKDDNGILNLNKLAAVLREREKTGKKGITD